MELDVYNIYCDVHGDIHEKSSDPYNYGYAESGEEPECGEENWKNIWIGAYSLQSK